ncbi:exonuclease, DNA polymerase III, epsilon subunit [Firmicutes bacterium M10-2]|nr:exonuclease, DNA polymerase III, epsilon subunit [Firmicutes bacterium M10-2]
MNKEHVTRRCVKEYPLMLDKMTDRYIAIDFETDGRDSKNGRVIEIGACLFENGKPTKKFSSLVHSVDYLPQFITELTGISLDMILHAPSEEKVWKEFVKFLDGALCGRELIVAHNAGFDTGFLKAGLERLGYSGQIRYLDTVHLSQKLLPYVSGHALNKVCEELQIELEHHHRALDDAIACGMILSVLRTDEDSLKKYTKQAVAKLTSKEMEVASIVFSMLIEQGISEKNFGIKKSSQGIVSLYYENEFFHYVIKDEHVYLLANLDALNKCPWKWTFANQNECEKGLFRLPIHDVRQLDYFRSRIVERAKKEKEETDREFARDPSLRTEWKYGIQRQTFKKIKPHLDLQKTIVFDGKPCKGRSIELLQPLFFEKSVNRLFDLSDYEDGLIYKFYLSKAVEARKQHQFKQAHAYLQRAYANGLRCAEMYMEIANYYKYQDKKHKEIEWLITGAKMMDALHLIKERQLLLLRAGKLLCRKKTKKDLIDE